MSELLVSVVIVNHNGIRFVDECLRSVLGSNCKSFEVIFVDNASSDASLELVKRNFGSNSRLKFVENRASVGPAVGRNSGARVAQGKYLVFLDNDTKVEPDCFDELARVLETDPTIGSAQAKLLRMDTNFYDCAGDYLGPLGFLIERSRGKEDRGQLDYVTDILSAKSAASIIRRDLFEHIGGFDGDFYMYLEETDLSWRVWLAGFRVVFIPRAVVYHAFNTARKDFKAYYPKYIVRYYGCRNYISTLIKNLELKNWVRFLPLHITCWLLLSVFFAFKARFADTFYILKGIGWNFINLGFLFDKRCAINAKIRVVCDRQILSRVIGKKRTSYYLGKASAYLSGRAF